MASLLLVEDDETLASGLSFALGREGHAVTCAKSKAEAEACLARAGFDLLVLDVMLPDGSGFEICQAVRRRSPVPVIFLTARDEEVNVVRGLDLGADDYVAKPFRVRELVSRISAALRRVDPGGAAGQRVLRAGPLTIDLGAARVYRGTEEVRLSAEEFRLLSLFARNPGQALTRGMIMERLLDSAQPFVDDNTLSVYVRRLREKLEEDPAAPRLIVTVRGVGYRWEGARPGTEADIARPGGARQGTEAEIARPGGDAPSGGRLG
jgi:two-component system, OmpR family, response regulator RegX3